MLSLGDVCRVGDEKKGKKNLTTLMVVITPSMENRTPVKLFVVSLWYEPQP
jgi:hypothetical protein